MTEQTISRAVTLISFFSPFLAETFSDTMRVKPNTGNIILYSGFVKRVRDKIKTKLSNVRKVHCVFTEDKTSFTESAGD